MIEFAFTMHNIPPMIIRKPSGDQCVSGRHMAFCLVFWTNLYFL